MNDKHMHARGQATLHKQCNYVKRMYAGHPSQTCATSDAIPVDKASEHPTKSSSNYPQIVLKSSSNRPQIILKSSSNRPQIILKSSSNPTQIVLKSYSNRPQIVLKSYSNRPQIVLESSSNRPQIPPERPTSTSGSPVKPAVIRIQSSSILSSFI